MALTNRTCVAFDSGLQRWISALRGKPVQGTVIDQAAFVYHEIAANAERAADPVAA